MKKSYLCPERTTCEASCSTCIYGKAFAKCAKKIAALQRQKFALESQLNRYKKLGTVKELREEIERLRG